MVSGCSLVRMARNRHVSEVWVAVCRSASGEMVRGVARERVLR